jgi:hypothetical protein
MVPLMQEKQMMINCKRPLVIYESMEIEFKHLNLTHPKAIMPVLMLKENGDWLHSISTLKIKKKL